MTTEQGMQMAKQLLYDQGYGMAFGVKEIDTKKAIARVNFRDQYVEFSSILFPCMLEEYAVNTVKHEIAHVMAGTRHKHDRTWVACMRSIGGDPTVSSTEDEFDNIKLKEAFKTMYKYTLVCDQCGYTSGKSRCHGGRTSCPDCFPHTFNEEFLLRVIKNW